MRTLPTPLLCAALAALAVSPALAGCGGDETQLGEATAAAPPATRYLTASDLQRDLGNGFRDALYRLAVMSQPPDDAADLGQDMPTGMLDDVRCAAHGSRPVAAAPWLWRCRVHWRTVDGAARRTVYAVRLLPTGCFAAGATPRLAPHRDTTIESYSEHPLNALASARKGC